MYSSILGNVPLFSSSISLDQEVFKVLILNPPGSAHMHICIYLQLADHHLHPRERSHDNTYTIYISL